MTVRPDIKRYFHDEPHNLTSETFETLNPTGSYTSWVQYISAFLQSYLHVMSIHPNLSHLHHLQDPLQKLIDKLEEKSSPETWIEELRHEAGLKGRLWHRDLHLGNFLGDTEGKIHGIIDWEFAGVGVGVLKADTVCSTNQNVSHPSLVHLPLCETCYTGLSTTSPNSLKMFLMF